MHCKQIVKALNKKDFVLEHDEQDDEIEDEEDEDEVVYGVDDDSDTGSDD